MSNDLDIFRGLCRFCGLQKSCIKYIFSSEAMKNGLLTRIKNLFPEEVDLINCDTVLPKFICDTCDTTVNYFHDFQNGVKLVQQNLQKKLQDDMSKECKEIRKTKPQHVCSASKKPEVLHIRYRSEGSISCLSCNAELQRDEILSSCDTKQPICICDECGFKDKVDMFISREDLSSGCPKCAYMKEKSLSPEKPKTYDCEVCTKSFKCRGHLNRHLLTHYGSKPFACEECDSRFNQKSSLRTHMLIHDKANPFSCTWCGQQFRHKQTLTNHVVGVHGVISNSTHYECDKCKKRFVQKEKLVRHYRSHTGERPYKCDLCDRTFTQQVNLKTHYKKHESEMQLSNLCQTEMLSDNSVDNQVIRPVAISPLVSGKDRFTDSSRDTLVETKRPEHNYTSSSTLNVKRAEENFTQMPHSVLIEAEKGKLIQELLSFESMAPENDPLETFPSIEQNDYREDLKVSGNSNAIYFNSSSSNYIMYSSNSSLYDMDNVSQCSTLPTFSSLNQVP